MLFRDRAFIELDTVDSTNNYAAKLLKLSSPPEGTVITAQEQTAGRGQRGATWESAKGDNLLMSLVLYPTFLPATHTFYLSKCLSLALAEMLEDELHTEVWIKWPNDLIVRDRKIAGMLLEFAWSDQQVQSAIAGIGLNVNQRHFSLSTATSMYQQSGRYFPVKNILDHLLRTIAKHYTQLRAANWAAIDEGYHQRLYRKDAEAPFEWKGERIRATIRSVDTSGQLLLDSEHGPLSCDLREIRMVLS